jgi:hypothetical protein
MKRQLADLILALLLIAFIASGAFAVEPAPGPAGTPGIEKGQPLIVKGKVAFAKGLGGYYLNGEDPKGELMIVNQIPTLLEGLLKSDKMVVIDGRLRGADFLFIEKIDGKPYQGEPPSR